MYTFLNYEICYFQCRVFYVVMSCVAERSYCHLGGSWYPKMVPAEH